MGNLILCSSKKARHPYYVEQLGIRLYTGEELSYFIYNNLMLLDESFLDERLYRFLENEAGLPETAGKLRRWRGSAGFGELLLVILQDVHYYGSQELLAFQAETKRLAREERENIVKERADYLVGVGRCYDAVRLYDLIPNLRYDRALSDPFKASIQYNKGAALARLFAFSDAVACYRSCYQLSGNEEALKRICYIRQLAPETPGAAEALAGTDPEKIAAWQAEFETEKARADAGGKAAALAALENRDAIRKGAGYKKQVEEWQAEYRRCQN